MSREKWSALLWSDRPLDGKRKGKTTRLSDDDDDDDATDDDDDEDDDDDACDIF